MVSGCGYFKLFAWVGFDLQSAVCLGVVSWFLVLVVYFGLVGLGLWVGGCGRLCVEFGGVFVYLGLR